MRSVSPKPTLFPVTALPAGVGTMCLCHPAAVRSQPPPMACGLPARRLLELPSYSIIRSLMSLCPRHWHACRVTLISLL